MDCRCWGYWRSTMTTTISSDGPYYSLRRPSHTLTPNRGLIELPPSSVSRNSMGQRVATHITDSTGLVRRMIEGCSDIRTLCPVPQVRRPVSLWLRVIGGCWRAVLQYLGTLEIGTRLGELYRDASKMKGGMFTTSIPYFQFLALLDAVTQYANDARRFAQAQASRGSRPS